MRRQLAAAPLALVAVLALASAALGLWSRPAASAVALAAAFALARRSPAAALACGALAVRLVLPDPAWPTLPPLRDALASPIFRAIPEPDASIAVGSLLGGRASLPRDVYEAFTRTGTSHLLAVSGFNITLAASGLGFALRPLGSRVAVGGALATALAFAVVAGFGASVARAAVMTCAATIGVLLGRPGSGLNALGAAIALLLLVAPGAVGDAGFLLSVSATAGLVLAARPLEERLFGPAWLRAQLAATLAASLASLPVVAALFGRLSLVSPLANLAVAPLVPPLMTATGVALLLGPVAEPLARVPAWLAFLCARLLRGIVELLAGFPAASVAVPPALVVAAVAVIGLAVASRRRAGLAALARALFDALPPPTQTRPSSLSDDPSSPAAPGRSRWSLPPPRRPRWRALALVLAGALAVAAAPRALAASDAPRVVALDVGQGDAFLVEFRGRRLLVDGGPDGRRVLRALGEVLPFFARRLDVVALTHAHADHATGLAAVLERYAVSLAIEPVGMEDGDVARTWRDALARAGVPLRAVGRGDRLRVGDLVVEVLAPFGDPADPLANLVLRVRAGGLSALFLGDATERGQADLLLRPDELAANVYVPPHHGAATPHAAALARAVAPRVALLSLGAGNRYGHPVPDTLRALAQARVLRTDRDGTLEVTADAGALRCRPARASALPGPWGGWLSRAPPCV